MKFPKSFDRLVEELQKLPSIGIKMSTRLALALFKKRFENQSFIEALQGLSSLKECNICNSISENDICDICSAMRDSTKLMIVEDYMDLVTIENSNCFEGYYYILGNLLSPLNNIMPSDLKLDKLLNRAKTLFKHSNERLEMIFALNPIMEGESTILYIKAEIEEQGFTDKIILTRLALGIPRGSDIEYIDSDTINYSVNRRSKI